MGKFFQALTLGSVLVASFAVHADFDKRWFDRVVMGRDLIIRTEKTRTPVKVHGTTRPFSLESGPAIDMGKFFDFPENLSAVALKSGKIVYERYAEDKGFSKDFLAQGQSMAKTAVGISIGHLLCDGKIDSLDDPLGKYSANLADSVYADITIRNVMRMASGVKRDRGDESHFNQILRHKYDDGANDQIAVIKSVTKQFSDQGLISRYHTLDAVAGSLLVSDVTGKSLDEYFYEKVYSNINPAEKMIWQADKNGNGLGHVGLYMIPRDWAKFGQYIVTELNNNSCLGQFIKDGLDNSIETTERSDQQYGYFFWVSEVPEGKVVVLTGKGGQIMIPNHYNNSVVVAFSASDFSYRKGKFSGKKPIVSGIMVPASKYLTD